MAVDFKKLGKKAKASSKKNAKAAKATSKAESSTAKPRGKGEFDDSNRFVLFVNDKDGNDARPDYTGKVNIVMPRDAKKGESVELRLAGWIQDSPKIGQFISGRVSEPQAQE